MKLITVNKSGYETTVLAFSGLAPRNDIFEWMGSFRNFNVNLVGVRDRYNSWYRTDFEQLLDNLKQVIEDLNTKYLGCVGGSAGGFASLMFGKELKANRIIAFCPQSACGKIKRDLGDDRWPNFCLNTPEFDISDNYSNAVVYCAENDELDMMHVERLNGIDLRKSKSGGHILPTIFKEEGKLETIFREILC